MNEIVPAAVNLESNRSRGNRIERFEKQKKERRNTRRELLPAWKLRPAGINVSSGYCWDRRGRGAAINLLLFVYSRILRLATKERFNSRMRL